jgi:hypothetical protein
VPVGAAGALLTGAIALRFYERHAGLLYPDGYQYLLMARGIAQHLRPTTVLGPGGLAFRPNLDAATKPLFPAIVALVYEAGVHLRSASEAVAALAAALASVPAALLVWRLSGSAVAAAAAGLALLASPQLAYWWGYAGPDPLAIALALLAAWLALGRRGFAAGVVGALAGATRPELLVLGVAVTLAALCARSTRPTALRAAAGGLIALAAVLALLRPPLELSSELRLAPVAIVGGSLAVGTAWIAGGHRRLGAALALAMLLGVVGVCATGRVPAIVHMAGDEWPLCAAALLGCLALALTGRLRVLLVSLAVAWLLGATYAYKNPTSGRYVADLIPLVCVLAATGLGAVLTDSRLASRLGRARWALAACTVVLGVCDSVLGSAPSAPGLDPFAEVAPLFAKLPPGPLVTATPDAYGELLPARTMRALRPGARGLIVLDGAQRFYAPGYTASGPVVLSTLPLDGFVRPDGTTDEGPTVVADGVARLARLRESHH